jgi:hypothetical protein
VANLPDYNHLYEAYKRGDPAGDSVQLHYLAQIPDLSRAEFMGLAEDIERLANSYSDAARKELTLGQLGYFLPRVKQAIAEKPFKPTRTASGLPVNVNPDDLQATQESLKSLPESEVVHDDNLHAIWKASQQGTLASGQDTLQPGAGLSPAPLPAIPQPSSQTQEQPKDDLDLSEITRWAIDRPNQQGGSQDLSEPVAIPKVPPIQQTADQIASKTNVDSAPVGMDRSFVPSVVPDVSRGQGNQDIETDRLELSDDDTDWETNSPQPQSGIREVNEPVTSSVPRVQPSQPIQTTSSDMLQASESEPMQTPTVEPASRGTRFLDWMQRGADALGVVDQTGVTDLANSTVSFTRAAFTRDENQQREHLINAGVSMVSAIPIVGDAAKLWKYNRLAKQSAAAGGGVNAAGQAVSVAPALQTGGAGGNIPPVIPPVAPPASPQPGGNPSPNNPGFFARMFGGGNANPPQTQTGGAGGGVPPVVPPVVPPGNNGGGGFFGNNISQLFGGNAAQGGSGYFANGGGFFGGGGGVNAPGSAAATQIPNRVMNAVNQGVQGIAGGAAAIGMTIPGLQPFAAALGAGTAALNQFNAGIEAVDRTNQAIIEGNRELAQLNGGLAGAYVGYDARTFQRDIRRSEEMEGVMPGLTEAQSDFADAQQDLYGPYAQLGVVIQTQLTSAATTLIKILDWLEPFGEIIKFYTDKPEGQQDPFAARNAMEKGVNDFIFGRKDPFINPPNPAAPRPPVLGQGHAPKI